MKLCNPFRSASKRAVRVFLKTADKPYHEAVLESFAEGVRRAGDDVDLCRRVRYEPCDVAVLFGSWKDKDSRHHRFKRELIRAHDGRLVVLETPLLGRRMVDEHPYFRVALDHFLQDEADFANRDSPPDRWLHLQRELGIELRPWRDGGEHVLVLLQLVGDASLRGADILAWARACAEEIRAHTKRPILLRPHPQLSRRTARELDAFGLSTPGTRLLHPLETTLQEDLERCWACVSFTSGGAVEAAIAGVPVFTLDPGSPARPVGNHDLADIESPARPDRSQWLHDLAYAQWSPAEMAAGRPWLRLRERVRLSR